VSRPTLTWADIEPAHEQLARTLGDLDTILKRRGDLSERQAFRRGFVTLNHGVETALNHLTLLYNLLLEGEEDNKPASPSARPLGAVLADIVAQGHYYEIYGPGYIGRDAASVYTRRLGTEGFKGESIDEHRRWVEDVEDGEARAATVAAAAETRLAQIRALHAEKLERDGLEADVPDEVKRS
jgi:hypothetical protein